MARPSNTEEKRKALLIKATEVFKKFGYDKTTIDDIAKAMKLNKASLYYYVKNKEELFLEILLNEATQQMESMYEEVAKVKDPMKRLLCFFNLRVDVYIGLIKLNSISKETILALQPIFFKIYEATEAKEFQFACDLIGNGKLSTLKGAKLHGFTQLLIQACNALKHETVLFTNLLDGDSEELKNLKTKIEKVVKLFIKSDHSIVKF
jgi:AcrR family transcriptional regulator